MFDDGWDTYREKVFAKQKELGIAPQDAELSRHDPDVQDWDALPEDERRLYARMMEVFAGFLEHTDFHIGRPFDFLKKIGELRLVDKGALDVYLEQAPSVVLADNFDSQHLATVRGGLKLWRLYDALKLL